MSFSHASVEKNVVSLRLASSSLHCLLAPDWLMDGTGRQQTKDCGQRHQCFANVCGHYLESE